MMQKISMLIGTIDFFIMKKDKQGQLFENRIQKN